jgi:hypothetical protein
MLVLVPAVPARAAPGLPVFTEGPPAFLEAGLGGTVRLGWVAEAPGDPSWWSMRMERSIGDGPWVSIGSCSSSMGTTVNCGISFAAKLSDTGARYRGVARNAAGSVVSRTTMLTVCEGPLPCSKTVIPGSAAVTEGSSGTTAVNVPVALSSPSDQTVTVEWRTVHVPGAPADQAHPTSDYTPTSGTVTFAPGETSKTVAVAVNGDALVEPDEYLVVSFHDPTNAVMGGFWGLGFGGITNDD